MRFQSKRAEDETQTYQSASTTDQFPDEEQVRDVYRVAYGYVGNREEAEDLTERICTRAIRAVAGAAAQSRNEMADLLHRSTAAIIEEHLRGFFASSSTDSSVIVGLFDLPETDVRQRMQAGTPNIIDHILAQLSAVDRDVLSYRFLRNATLAETAAQMHVPLADVMALQWSALKNAAQLLAQEQMIRSTHQAGSTAHSPHARPANTQGTQG